MRKKILVLSALALVLSANLRAQVTIGDLTPPKAGALLDLNSTTQGGLLLSNVDLPDLNLIPANTFVNISTAQDSNPELAGMIVYNTYEPTGIGIHIWDGEDWIKPCAPPAPEEIIFSETNICGSGVTFTAKIDSIKGATNYVWTLPAGLTGTSNDTIITITGVAGTYLAGSITIRAENSCGGGTRRAGTHKIVINALPTVPTDPTNNSRCKAGKVTFGATVPDGITIDWYDAPTGGAIVSGGDGTTSFLPSLSATTTYYAQARNKTTGCVSNSRLAVTGTVYSGVGQAVISGASSNVCPANTVTLTATASGATNFIWYKDGAQVQSGTSNTYTVSATGNYTVMGANAACIGTISAAKSVTLTVCTYDMICGVHVYQTSSVYDGDLTWAAADSWCKARGARLPTSTEAMCLCRNRAIVPAGWYDNLVWTSTTSGNGDNDNFKYCTHTPNNNCHLYDTHVSASLWFRCVK
jgi:hypothetical protein